MSCPKAYLDGDTYNCTRRSRRVLVMTDTDDRLIAAAAIIGDINVPVNGYKTPAATGLPMALYAKAKNRFCLMLRRWHAPECARVGFP